MSTKQEVLDAIAAEKAEVEAKIMELNDKITDLEERIGTGNPVTPADLEEIRLAVQDIHNANVKPVEPEE